MPTIDVVAIGLASLALGVLCGSTAVLWAVNKALREEIMTIEEIMAHEAMMVGRPVFYVDGWEFKSEKEAIQVVFFDAAPLVLPDQKWMHERRYSLYVDGEVRQSGNIRTWFSD